MKPVKAFVTKSKKDGKLLAYANVMFALTPDADASLTIDGFKLFEGKDGKFVAMPSQLGKDKEGNDAWYDRVKINKETDDGKALNEAILECVLKGYNYKEKKDSNPTEDDDFKW